MKRAVAFVLLVVASCKKPPPPTADAGTAVKVAPDSVPSASPSAAPAEDDKPVGAEREEDASISVPLERPQVPANLPTVSEDLQLVAVGKGFGSKLVWLKQIGSRVWLSGKNVDAYSDGDGALVPGPDLLKGLPYQGSKHVIWVAGAYPNVYALRMKNVSYRVESQQTTAFALKDGKWIQAEQLAKDHQPHAFITWGNGALMVWSDVVNSTVYYGGGQGTQLQTVDPNGKLGDPGLKIDDAFVAWDASSDGTTLSLIGSRGGARKDEDMFERGIWLVRGTKASMKLIPLLPNVVAGHGADLSDVIETGKQVLVKPPSYGSVTWAKSPTAFLVGNDGKPKNRPLGIGTCEAFRATLVSDTIWVIESCSKRATGEHQLVRISPDGKTERIAMPALVKKEAGYRLASAEEQGAVPCQPWNLISRNEGDLWIELECGRRTGETGGRWSAKAGIIPAILRKGHAQEPILLP